MERGSVDTGRPTGAMPCDGRSSAAPTKGPRDAGGRLSDPSLQPSGAPPTPHPDFGL